MNNIRITRGNAINTYDKDHMYLKEELGYDYHIISENHEFYFCVNTNGTCYEIRPIEMKNKKEIQWNELPLSVRKELFINFYSKEYDKKINKKIELNNRYNFSC